MLRNVAIFVVAISAMCVGVVFGQSTEQRTQQEQWPSWKDAVSPMPPEPAQAKDRELRVARNAQFDDKSGLKRPLDLNPEEPDPTTGHGASIYYTRSNPLPSSLSDSVAVGRVTTFQPYFSNDKTAIYTELQFQVEKVFKDHSRSIATAIAIDERGGAIRLPDGRVAKEDRFPLETDIDVGRRYVLFLTYDPETKSFRIVKAWELRDGQAQPLAKTDLKDQRAGLSKYAGMPEADFLNAVQQSVTPTSK